MGEVPQPYELVIVTFVSTPTADAYILLHRPPISFQHDAMDSISDMKHAIIYNQKYPLSSWSSSWGLFGSALGLPSGDFGLAPA